jgi:hypothetical protein
MRCRVGSLVGVTAAAIGLLLSTACAGPATAPASQIGALAHKAIRESSGVIASRRFPGVFWTHNDSGNDPVLYAVTQNGTTLREFPVAAEMNDWEDIATDDAGRLYIADTGNNKRDRKHLRVLQIAEPDPSQGAKAEALVPLAVWKLAYPGERFDCESLFIFKDDGYVISKVEPPARARIYRFPLTKQRGAIPLEEVTSIAAEGAVTSADISPDGRWLAVLGTDGLRVLEINGDIALAGKARATIIALPPLHLEGCCFAPGGILLTAETREILLCPFPATQPAAAR